MDGQLPSIITTGLIAGTLHARQARHPWLDQATELEWAMISELTTASPYQMRAVMHFLDRVPDRDRAVKAFGQCGRSSSTRAWSPWTRTRPGRSIPRWTSPRCPARWPAACSGRT